MKSTPDDLLDAALTDLREAITDAMLGSVESVVLDAALAALIVNWNDHLPEYRIDPQAALVRHNLRQPIDS